MAATMTPTWMPRANPVDSTATPTAMSSDVPTRTGSGVGIGV